jgi:hypothetical protein
MFRKLFILLAALLWSFQASADGLYGGGAGGAAPLQAPAYQASKWYSDEYSATLVAGTALVITTTYCYPSYIRSTFTTNSLGVSISTLGVGSIAAALYNDNGGRPGTLIVASGSVADTATGTTPLAISSTQLIGPAVIWKCFQGSDTTVRLLSFGSALQYFASMLGATALSAVLNTTSQTTFITVTGGTFGTWANLTGAAFVDGNTNTMPSIAIFVVSSP